MRICLAALVKLFIANNLSAHFVFFSIFKSKFLFHPAKVTTGLRSVDRDSIRILSNFHSDPLSAWAPVGDYLLGPTLVLDVFELPLKNTYCEELASAHSDYW